MILDKFYTSKESAIFCFNELQEVIKEYGINVSEYIEPSAGSGGFSDLVECIAYDIAPDSENIIKADFLELDISYKEGRVIFGNPPFGKRNNLARRFYKKSCKICDVIAFILPISQLKCSKELPDSQRKLEYYPLLNKTQRFRSPQA